VFESERPPRQRYPSDLTDLTWPRLRHLLVRPHQRRAAMPPRALASTSKQACTSAAPAAPVRVLPHDFVVSWPATHKHFLRWTSDGTWDRALAELQHPGPPCPRPQPGALGRGDRLLLDQSVTRSWSSRLRRRQEDRRHQTPHCRGHPGLLVAVLVTAASVQDRAAVPRLLGRARYRCPRLGHLRAEQGYTGSVVQAVSRIVRFTIQIVGGIKLRAALSPSLVAGSSSGLSPGCSAADASPASTSRPHWPMRPWSSSASSRSCSAA
jgi:hypothetical protein